MEPNRESKIHLFLCFRRCGRVCRRVALFYCVRRKRVFIAMDNENVDFRTSIFTVISMEFLLGPLGVPRTPQNYFWKSPRRSQGRPWGFQGRPEGPWGRSRDPLGPPWAPLGLPRNAPGRFLNAQGSLGALQCNLGTLFSRPGVLQDIVFQRYCIKSSGIPRMTFR